MSKYEISKQDMLLLIMDYLHQEGYDQSYISLEQESGVNLFNYDVQINLIRKLILDGEWEEVEKFLDEIKQLNNFPYNSLIFEIKKEKLIEEVELQQDPNDSENLVQQLKEIQQLGFGQEFNDLLTFLNNNNSETSKRRNPISRRLNTFNLIRDNLIEYFPIAKNESIIHPGKMKEILSRCIERISGNSHNYKNKILSLNDMESLLDAKNDNVSFETKQNKNIVIKNTISSIEKNDNSNKFINTTENNIFINQTGGIEKQINIYDDFDMNIQIENDGSNSGIGLSKHHINQNDLSDLDQEEYYMKSCYDYYNYDITTLTLKKVIEDSHPIRCCCFSPKGDFFAIGTNSKSIKIFDLSYILDNFNNRNSSKYHDSKRYVNQKETIGMIFEQKNHHYGSIYCIDWSTSGKLLATGSNDKTIKLMNIPELEGGEVMKELETLELQISGIKGIVRSVCFEPSNDLTLLSANQGESTVKLWDTEKGVMITNLEGHASDVTVVKWSNDSQLCASSGMDKTIRFWDLREYKNTNILSGLKYAEVNDISIYTKQRANNNTIIAAGHIDGLITIWDYSKRCVVKEIYEHSEEVRSVSFSPDGRYLISGSFDSKIKIFDVNNDFKLLGELEHSDRVVSCKWHPAIPLITSTSADKTARVWIPQKY